MGMIEMALSMLFGGGRNVLKDTVEVFRENAEGAAKRQATYRTAALGQFAAEFAVPRKGAFDRFMDALNRVPRPAMALGTMALFISAMVDPIWFASRMQGIALVPQPLWWLLGAIVSFYFGARYQVKGQEFQRSIAQTVLLAADVTNNIKALREIEHGTTEEAVAALQTVEAAGAVSAIDTDANQALDDWRAQT
jgi:hypothetical protein